MQLRDLEYFAAVAEHRHIGRAAEALDLSQPALSKSLRRLEQSLGARLVNRTPKGIELTAEGAALVSHVRQLRLSVADVAREIADLSAGRTGQLRVGAAPGVVEDLLASACSAFVADAPNVTLTVTVAANDALLPALRSGELDLIVSGVPTPPPDDLVHERLLDDEVVVFASTKHPLARRKRVSVAEVGRERWAMTVLNAQDGNLPQRVFEDSGLRDPRIAVKTSYLPLRDHMVASSSLLGLSSRRLLRQMSHRLSVVELPVRELMRSRCIAVSYRKDAYLSPAARRLIALLRTTAAG